MIAYLWVYPVLAPVAAMVANALLVLVVNRIAPGIRFIVTIGIGFAAGLLLLGVAETQRLQGALAGDWVAACYSAGNLVTYVCLSFGFFNFLNVGESSLRVRILREVEQAGGRLAEDALFERYGDAVIIGMRVERMRRHGQLVERNGRYVLRSRLLFAIAMLFRFLKRLLLRRSSEFDTAATR